jgi:hypothetical protein
MLRFGDVWSGEEEVLLTAAAAGLAVLCQSWIWTMFWKLLAGVVDEAGEVIGG